MLVNYKNFLASMLLFYVIILLPNQFLGRILRLQCKMYADFNVVQRGYWLQGSVIAEYQDTGIHTCQTHCLHNPDCKSINIEKDDYGACQLNSKSANDVLDRVQTTSNQRWNFHSTNFSDRTVGQNCKALKPCKNDEICLDTCSCPGHECLKCLGNDRGLHCNRCQSQPCQNGGTCDEESDPLCSCAPGFQGTYCETDFNECSSSPCVNGLCNHSINKFSCVCNDGWTGILCETEIG